MPIDRTPILPNQIWKEEEKIWVSTPKNEGTNDNNQELSAVSNVKTQDSQEPKKNDDKIEKLPNPLKSDEITEVLDKFVQIACLPDIHKSEYDFIQIVDEFISCLILDSNLNECSYLREHLQELCAKYNTPDDSLALRYIRHLDENTKFSKYKTKWQNFMKKAENFTIGGLLYPISDLNIKNPAGFTYSVLTTDRYWENPNQESEIDEIIKDIEDLSVKSLSVIDSDEDYNPDPENNADFDRMKERESLQARQHFQTQAYSLGGLRKKFNNQSELLRKILQKAQCSPEIDRKSIIQSEFQKLSQQYQKIETQRYLAIQYFSEKTKNLDTYLNNIYKIYLEIKEQVNKISNKSNVVSNLEIVESKVVCDFCAAAAMTTAELKLHMHEFHRISEGGPQNSPPLIQRGRPRSKNLDTSARGSYRKRLDSSSSDLHLNEQSEQNSVKNQVDSNQTTSLLTNMMLYNMKAQYNIKDTVPIFNPNPIKEKERFTRYMQWSLYLTAAESDMKNLQMTENEMFNQLCRVVQGDAKDCILATKPEDAKFSVAKSKLNAKFMNRTLYLSELGCRLNSIEPMSQNDPTKMQHFVDVVQNIIKEFRSISPESDDLLLFYVHQQLFDKLNKSAQSRWLEITEKFESNDSPYGHSLKIQDFIDILEAVTKSALHKQRMGLYRNHNSSKPKGGKDSNKNKNFSEPEKTFSYNTYQKSPKNRKDIKCSVPTCGATLGKGPNTHQYLCQCPKLKELSYKTVKNWFDTNGLKCVHCMSDQHDRNSCEFKNYKCKKRVLRDGRKMPCGRSHHFSLHNPREDGILVDNLKKQPQQGQNRTQ